MEPFKIIVSSDGRVRAGLVVLGRSVEFSTVPLPGVSAQALRERGLRYLIFDLSRVVYVNSSGLGWFVRLADELRLLGGELVLINLSSRATWVLQILGLEAFFQLSGDLQSAFETLAELPGGP